MPLTVKAKVTAAVRINDVPYAAGAIVDVDEITLANLSRKGLLQAVDEIRSVRSQPADSSSSSSPSQKSGTKHHER